MSSTKVWSIVLTGGPCAGKTTGVEVLRKKLCGSGVRLMVVPEVATLVFEAGVPRGLVGGGTAEQRIELQHRIMRIQIELEESMISLAKTLQEPTVVLSDRGVLDGKAFYTPEIWKGILNAGNWTDEDLLRRYNGVVHLVTAADGAVEFYTTSNNATRMETPDQAVAQDRQLQKVYRGHPHNIVIGNEGGFDLKMNACTDAIMRLISDGGNLKSHL